ncbi:MAG TPA: NAD(P)H-hydrate dehydratase [Bacillota bacterium]|nr:NAD(P)H-hydrate dehydratase [Bacillota bacterium]HOK68047.1 NAD(P)H-hydrate dehydratase [Bacillota bacterium]
MEKNYTGPQTLSFIKKRPADSHKGVFGTLVSLTGSRYMTGAAYLSSMGALRSGVGLLKLAADDYVQSVLKTCLYEAVFIRPDEMIKQNASAYLIGCGIGREYDGLLRTLLPCLDKPTIIDADGINYVAANINVLKNMRSSASPILTPHPAEMGRLLNRDTAYVQSGREQVALSFAAEYGCVLVLKGKNTVIAAPDGRLTVNTSGNSGLSKGGSGDVLAGVIASLCAQGYSPYDAAVVGVYVHGLAADRLAAKYGEHGLLPRDLPAEIGAILG